jgi:AcrR family transcriptional regulator
MDQDNGKSRQQLERGDWIEAALDVLAEEGLDGLRVESLAKGFGVTKGSFYWHFKDRQDLFAAVLDNWKQGRIRDISRQTASDPGHEHEQLRRLIEIHSAARNRKGVWTELAVRDWARHDAAAATIVEEVDAWRLDCTRRLFVACGFPEDEARSRSLLLFAYVFGHSLMAYDRNDPKTADSRRWITERILGA